MVKWGSLYKYQKNYTLNIRINESHKCQNNGFYAPPFPFPDEAIEITLIEKDPDELPPTGAVPDPAVVDPSVIRSKLMYPEPPPPPPATALPLLPPPPPVHIPNRDN